jgi:hypothetical protein
LAIRAFGRDEIATLLEQQPEVEPLDGVAVQCDGGPGSGAIGETVPTPCD